MVWLGNNNRSPINVPFFVHCPSLFFVCSSRCRQLPPILLSFLPSCLVIVNTSCSRSRALRVPATPYALITLLLTATAAAYLVLLGSAWSTSSTRRYCFCFPCRFVSRAVALALAVLRCAGAPRTPHFPVSRHQHVPVCCFFLAKEHFTVLPCPVSRSSSFFFFYPISCPGVIHAAQTTSPRSFFFFVYPSPFFFVFLLANRLIISVPWSCLLPSSPSSCCVRLGHSVAAKTT